MANDDTIARVLREAMPHAVTRAEDQIALVRRYRAGDLKAKETLLVGSIGLAVRIFSPYLGIARDHGLEAADLLTISLYGPGGDGKSGMVRAIERFDPDRGFRLSSYAHFWVRDALGKALRSAGCVRIPDRRPSAARPVLVQCEFDESMGGAYDPLEATEAECLAEELEAAVSELSPRDQYIIRKRFGPAEMLLGDIAKSLGISKERARQLEAEAIAKLREIMG